MRLVATKTSAAVAGAWTAVGMMVADRFAWDRPTGLKSTIVMMVFFFVPVFVAVIGTEAIGRCWHDWRFTAGFGRDSWRWRAHIWLRMLMWFLGAALTTPIISFLIYGKWPI